MKFVRFLYGSVELVKHIHGIRRAVRHSLNHPIESVRKFFRNEIYYYTLGREATKLLRKCGAKRIIQVDKRSLLRLEGGKCRSWHKLYLIKVALEEHGAVLYTDFDAKVRQEFDPNKIRKIVTERDGLGKLLQMAVVMYHKEKYFHRKNNGKTGWELISARKGLMGSLIYLSSTQLLKYFMEDYEELVAIKCKSYKNNKGRNWVGDERAITYSIEKRFGPMTIRDFYENLEPEVIWNVTSPLRYLGVEKEYPVFRHA